jgi:Transglycosylase SLT domain
MKRLGCAVPLAAALLNTSALAAVPAGYRQVAQAQGVPATVLYAVALTESGATLASGERRPWPWTLNVEGRAYRFRTRLEARQALRVFLARGITRIDIGLMQVNWAYHKQALGDPWQALDPYHNLAVGASILRAQYRSAGDWWQAVGRYHAPNNAERADRYGSRVASWYRRIAREGLSG